MIPRLQEYDFRISRAVHNAVLAGQPSRPCVRQFPLQWLGLSDPDEWITHHGLYQFQGA